MIHFSNSLSFCRLFLMLPIVLLLFVQQHHVVQAIDFGLNSNNNINNETKIMCNIASFVPFTYFGYWGTEIYYTYNTSNNIGYTHMASAVMAIEHFNTKNNVVVPELEHIQNCPIQLSSTFYDTEIYTHVSIQDLQNDILTTNDDDGNNVIPCAIAGPYNDLPAQLLGSIASSLSIPLVASRAINYRSTLFYYSPNSNQVYPSQYTIGSAVINYLQYVKRNNYIALVRPITDTAVQIHEVITTILTSYNVTHKSYTYDYPEIALNGQPKLPITDTFRTMKHDGYRTIIIISEFPEDELPILVNVTEQYNMNNGEYVYIFVGIDLNILYRYDIDIDNNANAFVKFLAGAAMITPLEGFILHPDNDAFLHAWKIQNFTLVNKINQLHPLKRRQPGYSKGNSDYFQTNNPGTGAGFIYDAIMSIGIGACDAYNNIQQQQSKNIKIPIDIFLESIRNVDFHGASGRIQFHENDAYPGGRNPSFVEYGVVNFFHLFTQVNETDWIAMLQSNPLPELYQVTAVLKSNGETSLEDAEWEILRPFYYRSGSTTPPILLRDIPEQNYLGKTMRVLGLIFMSIALVASVIASIWLYLHRTCEVVRKTQPFALHLICFGSFFMSWAILPLSFDESYGWTDKQLGMGCNSICWLVSLGFIIQYGALFSKLWRLNKVLQFRRRQVPIKQVSLPVITLCVTAIGILTFMSIFDPLRWDRVEIDEETGESIGRCRSDSWSFMWPLAITMLISALLTGVMAWKTLDVDASFSDASWVFALILVHLEVILLGMPVVYILSDLDTDGRYFGTVFIIFTFPASSLGLIILPKVVAYRKSLSGNNGASKRGAGAGQGGVHVYNPRNRNNVTESTTDNHTSTSKTISSGLCPESPIRQT